MSRKIITLFIFTVIFIAGFSIRYFYSEVFKKETFSEKEKIIFSVNKNESISGLATRLENEGIIRNAWLFEKYLILEKLDTKVKEGNYTVNSPITIARVANALRTVGAKEERSITIIPGWTLKDMAEYFEKEKLGTKEEFYSLVGKPATDYRVSSGSAPIFPGDDFKITKDKPKFVSYEGYFAPDTFRIYEDSSLEEVVKKLLVHREEQITDEMYAQIKENGRTVYETMIIASLLEKEVRGAKDKAIVSDLFWRRYDLNWALQADSTVHYATQKSGDVFTTSEDREVDSLWNTYKHPGLPLGPISNPSLESIMAAIYPEKNEYWYFLTTLDTGEVKYGRSLEEHNSNVYKYLR